MRAIIQLELNIKQFELIRKALVNYEGKIEHLLDKDLDLDFVKRLTAEKKILEPLIAELEANK